MFERRIEIKRFLRLAGKTARKTLKKSKRRFFLLVRHRVSDKYDARHPVSNIFRKEEFIETLRTGTVIVLVLFVFSAIVLKTSAEDEIVSEPVAVVETGDATAVADTENVINSSSLLVGSEGNNSGGEEIAPVESVVVSPESGEAAASQNSNSQNSASKGLTPEGDGVKQEGNDYVIQGSGYDGSVATIQPVSEPQTQNNQDAGGVNAQIENNSNALIQNNSGVLAKTGANQADNNPGDAVILTGDAQSAANIVNIVNSNIIDATGFFLLLNTFGALAADFDFRNLDLFSGGCPGDCSIFSRNSSLSALNNNDASITNEVIVRSSTGENSTSWNSGDGLIATGNAGAGANVFNLVNTNIVGSNYLVFAFNNFGSFSGDLVFPSKYLFEEFFNQDDCCAGGNLNVQNNSNAEVENSVEVVAQSGLNEANSGGDNSLIVSGDANSNVNVSNTLNSNLIGDDTFYLVVRVFGDWAGSIFSTPDHISWEETPEGLILQDNDNSAQAESSGQGGVDMNIQNNNQALVQNKVKVFALTGENKANNNGDDAIIATGDASAGANVVNVVNTNIIGRNWIMAFVNIFGDWEGGVAFGRPDLWVGERVVVPGDSLGPEVVPGAMLRYTLTVFNKGDTDATEVELNDKFLDSLLEFSDSDGGIYEGDGEVFWNLGTIKPGELKEVSYRVTVKPQIPYPATLFSNRASASSYEEDQDLADNVETTVIKLTRRNTTTPIHLREPHDPVLNLRKIQNVATTTAGSSLSYKLILTNDGYGSAYDVQVSDELINAENNEIVETKTWPLGEVFPNEEIIIEYDMEIATSAPSGIFKNMAHADGVNYNGAGRFSGTVSTKFEIYNLPDLYFVPPFVGSASSVAGSIESLGETISRLIEPLKLEIAEIPIPPPLAIQKPPLPDEFITSKVFTENMEVEGQSANPLLPPAPPYSSQVAAIFKRWFVDKFLSFFVLLASAAASMFYIKV